MQENRGKIRKGTLVWACSSQQEHIMRAG